ncbi:winged helix-turn-helix transcriptional regulator [bacterium]|jgi:Lrp/AsnC family transcriptional regulator, regulator for asnA, asnC and gidA|nr:winged helix-turn-helix transcriptional regulator [bacterium]
MKLDKLDPKIIELLRQNGAITNVELGKKLKVSEATIRYRVKKLLERNIIKIRGLLNPKMQEEKQLFYLCLTIAPRRELENTVHALLEYDEVINVVLITGRYDVIAEVFIDPHKLIDFQRDLDFNENVNIATIESFSTLKSFNKWI